MINSLLLVNCDKNSQIKYVLVDPNGVWPNPVACVVAGAAKPWNFEKKLNLF